MCLQFARSSQAADAFKKADALNILIIMLWLTRKFDQLDFTTGIARQRPTAEMGGIIFAGFRYPLESRLVFPPSEALKLPYGPLTLELDDVAALRAHFARAPSKRYNKRPGSSGINKKLNPAVNRRMTTVGEDKSMQRLKKTQGKGRVQKEGPKSTPIMTRSKTKELSCSHDTL